MRTKSFADMGCSIAGALEQVVDKWGILIMRDLGLGLSRFDEFQQSSGISPTTLTARLRQLQDAGLVEREKYQDHPARYRYLLTNKGQDFGLVLLAIAKWGDRYGLSGLGGPPVRFFDTESGEEVRLGVIGRESGNRVQQWQPAAGEAADERTHNRLKSGEEIRLSRLGKGSQTT